MLAGKDAENGLDANERAMLRVVKDAGPDGLASSELLRRMDMPPDVAQRAFRTLVTGRVVRLDKTKEGATIVRLSGPVISENFSVVLKVIKDSGTSGIDVATIASRTKVPKTEVNRAVNAFLQQEVIKETRSFTHRAKKLYIAAGLEPSHAVTGGTFYNEKRELDQDFISYVRRCIKNYVRVAVSADVAGIYGHLQGDTQIRRRPISLREAGIVANSLKLDGVLRRTRSGSSASTDVTDRTYTLAPGSSETGVTTAPLGGLTDEVAASVPCLSCPQHAQCSKLGVISPLSCAYLTDWAGASGVGSAAAAAAAEAPPPKGPNATVVPAAGVKRTAAPGHGGAPSGPSPPAKTHRVDVPTSPPVF